MQSYIYISIINWYIHIHMYIHPYIRIYTCVHIVQKVRLGAMQFVSSRVAKTQNGLKHTWHRNMGSHKEEPCPSRHHPVALCFSNKLVITGDSSWHDMQLVVVPVPKTVHLISARENGNKGKDLEEGMQNLWGQLVSKVVASIESPWHREQLLFLP